MAQKLALQWSPEQISGWLKQQFPTDRDMRISYEAIYRSLFVQTRGVLKKELTAQLRTRRQMRHAKGGKAKNGQGHILDMVMSGHKRFTVATNVQVYFCDPRSPWQRGSNENTNGLLRQYFPRGTDLSRFSQAYLNGIALRLNQRPRKTLAFETPANRLQLVLH